MKDPSALKAVLPLVVLSGGWQSPPGESKDLVAGEEMELERGEIRNFLAGVEV